MSFPEQLQILRKGKGLSQEKLAEMLGISRQAVAKWEVGHSYPDIARIQGYEEIYFDDMKVYECFFHGGIIK